MAALTLEVRVPGSAPEVVALADTGTIGRGKQNAVVVASTTLSRVHAELRREDGDWWLSDLGSSSGTWLNRVRITERTVVRNGDVIHVGQVDITCILLPAVSAEELPMIEALQNQSSNRLVFADWLETRGRLDEARYVRAELALHESPKASLLTELKNLKGAVAAEFRSLVAHAKVEGCERAACPGAWEKLALNAGTPRLRVCGTCSSAVTFCVSLGQAHGVVAFGRPAAVEPGHEREPGDIRPPYTVVG